MNKVLLFKDNLNVNDVGNYVSGPTPARMASVDPASSCISRTVNLNLQVGQSACLEMYIHNITTSVSTRQKNEGRKKGRKRKKKRNNPPHAPPLPKTCYTTMFNNLIYSNTLFGFSN